MSDPFKELVLLLERQTNKNAKALALQTESVLGTITDNGLKLDYFKHVIKDYLVADWVFDGEIEGSLEIPAHDKTGSVILPSIPTMSDSPTTPGQYMVTYKFDDWKFTASNEKKIKIEKIKLHFKPQLQPGDRVLAIPVNNGRDFVVISKVVSN